MLSSYKTNGEMPAPLSTLDDLVESGTQAMTPVKVFIGHNLGHRTFTLSVPMYEFYRMSDVANDRSKHGEAVSQRKLHLPHATGLARYILRGLVWSAIDRRIVNGLPVPKAYEDMQARVGRQPYMAMQPIVANLRDCKPNGSNLAGSKLITKSEETACFKVMLSQKDILWVVDGQHRRKAMDIVFNFLESVRLAQAYPKKQNLVPVDDATPSNEDLMLWQDCYEIARTHCSVQVELHLGLGVDEERQLFHDLNNLAKPVERSLAYEFDSSNPVNAFLKFELLDKNLIKAGEKDHKDWADDDGSVPYKDLIAVNAHLFLNKSNVGGATATDVEGKVETAKQFWTALTAIPGFGEAHAKEHTVAAQPVVMKALAKLVYDFGFGRKADIAGLSKILDGISDLDFSHANPMWRFYELSVEERKAHGLETLAAFLPSGEDGKNRDLGSFQGGFMRFGSKHNDIYPIIADMIRWKLGLPNRR